MTDMGPFWAALLAGLGNKNYAGNVLLGIPIYALFLLLIAALTLL